MKVVIYLALFLTAVACNETPAKPLDKEKEECVVELGLNRDEIIKLDALELPIDTNADYNRFVACDSKKKGLMTANGEILYSAIKKLLLELPDVKTLPKLVHSVYARIISDALKRCETLPLSEKDPGKNMIHVFTCMFKEMDNIKESMV
ncbi:hypothetical protein PPYR_07193 [Photinus pyralis]|uniref:Uncharacterized protein n=1 Tax=Photinus pyralis TaxID=7054 RepID=A0A1Y1LR35_PHOPY|nr:uncharacterized protein LOC116169391 [Photinus pyralis]KAB0799313.1 hypothetical protein PPYR_07193 [Photinus pyralis]